MNLLTLISTFILAITLGGASAAQARAMTCEGQVVTIENAQEIYKEVDSQINTFDTLRSIIYMLDSGLFDKMDRDSRFLERGLIVLRSFIQNGPSDKNFYAVSNDYATAMLINVSPEICKIPRYGCTSGSTDNAINVAGFLGCADCAASSNTPPNGTCATSCTQCCVHFGNSNGTRCGCPDPETCN